MFPILDGELLRAFVAVAQTRNFTRASEQLFRTQSAVSMQIKRLESVLGKVLFTRTGRRVELTADGELLLGFALRLLNLNDEVMAAFTEPKITGVVRIGTPDDYATCFLPEVLAPFANAYPQVRVEVVCDNSVELMPALEKGEFDLALVSRTEKARGGELLRREPLVWVTSPNHDTHEQSPLPLALFPQGCICREHAVTALHNHSRAWRMAYVSRNVSLLQAAVDAGLAVAAMEQSTLPDGVKLLGMEDGFPPLPEIEVVLHRAPGKLSAPASRLADFIVQRLTSPNVSTSLPTAAKALS